MPPILPPAISSPVESSIGWFSANAFTSYDFHVQNALPAGFVSVLIGDAEGNANLLTGITDSQGNSYTLDSVVNQPSGGGNAYIAHGDLTTALSTADKITVHTDQATWSSFYLLVIGFTEIVTGLDVAGAPQGLGYVSPASASLSVSTTPTAYPSLLIGLAAYQTTAADDSTWTHMVSASDIDQDHVVAAYQFLSSGGAVAYHTTAAVPPDGAIRFGASAVCAYAASAGPPPPPPPPPTTTTVVVGAISVGLRERKPCIARTTERQAEHT